MYDPIPIIDNDEKTTADKCNGKSLCGMELFFHRQFLEIKNIIISIKSVEGIRTQQ